MRRIRGLLVEDTADQADIIRKALNYEFGDAWDWTVEWTTCVNAFEARDCIRESDPFDFAIIDIRLGDEQAEGFSAARDLKKHSPGTFILVVSSYVDTFAKFHSKAREVGAYPVIRSQLNEDDGEWSWDKLAERIHQHVLASSPARPGDLQFDADHVGIVSVLESLSGTSAQDGATIVRGLAMSCLGPLSMRDPRFRLSYLAAGRSGAHVCRVDISGEGHRNQSFVLKLGLDRRALEQELKANHAATNTLREPDIVKIIGRVQVDERSGYAAIIARIAENAVGLCDWLTGPVAPADARSVAGMLMAEQLIVLSEPELRSEVPVEDWLATSAIKRLSTARMLADVRELLGHPAAAHRPDGAELCRLITEFVDTGALPVRKPPRLPGVVTRVHGFGDLHSANVLVLPSRHPRPVLIDASRFDSYHWSADPARLLVDVLLKVRRPGLPSMLWEDFEDSVRFAAGLCPLCGPLEPADTPVDHFIDEVVTHLAETRRFDELRIGEEAWHWQWHVGLAKEFLRQACHHGTPLPRGVLALVAGAEHLRCAGELIDELKF